MEQDRDFGTPSEFLEWLHRSDFSLVEFRREAKRGFGELCRNCVMAKYLQVRLGESRLTVGTQSAWVGNDNFRLPQWIVKVVEAFDCYQLIWNKDRMVTFYEEMLV